MRNIQHYDESLKTRNTISLFLWSVVDQRTIQSIGEALIFMQESPVSDQVTEGIVHWWPEAQCWHQTRGGVWSHEGQAPAVSRVRQPEWVQAQMRTERISARVGTKVWRVGLQWREGRSIAERHGSW